MTNHKKENVCEGGNPNAHVPPETHLKITDSLIIAPAAGNATLILTTKGGLSPREKRALTRLLEGAVSRREFQHIVGCVNGPGLVHVLRRMGYSIHTERVPCHDKDNFLTNYGRYTLCQSSRQKAIDALEACS